MLTTLQVTHDARGIATITLNRPEIRNAFDEVMIQELAITFEKINNDTAVRAIVIAASGDCFCAGADITWMQGAANQSQTANLEDARRFAAMMATMHGSSKPVIARVQGAAFGGGVGLICAADIVIASQSARFSVSEAKLGILPAVIGPYLIQAVGKRQALHLALTAAPIHAHDALAIGLVHKVVEAAQLDNAIGSTLDELLKNGPMALAEIKQLFSQLGYGPIDEQTRELTAQTISRVRTSAEARLGFSAFLEKRAPIWTVTVDVTASSEAAGTHL